ncbi:MAG: SpoVA/SpoVAEb family sporulation membrane protein [Clostridia bacterium]|nr:SpoVA/SpoVAEb family sporulation membrane protein [Clostridia bacterium]
MDILISLLKAFLAGGVLCGAAQLLIDLTKLTPARILVGYVCLGVFLGAIGVFEPLKDFFGCGVTVPLIGFGGNVARGVREAVDEIGVLGALTGSFRAAAGGTSAALCFGYLAALFAEGRPKRMSEKPGQTLK